MLPIILYLSKSPHTYPDNEKHWQSAQISSTDNKVSSAIETLSGELCQLKEYYDFTCIISDTSRNSEASISTSTLIDAIDKALERDNACLLVHLYYLSTDDSSKDKPKKSDHPSVYIGFGKSHGRFLEEGAWKNACTRANLKCKAKRLFRDHFIPDKYQNNKQVMSCSIGVDFVCNSQETKDELNSYNSLGELSHKLGILIVDLGSRATKYSEILERMKIPYKERLPIRWEDEDDSWMNNLIEAVGKDIIEEQIEAADIYAEEVWKGTVKPIDVTTIPKTKEELDHYIQYIRREYLASLILEYIDTEGETIDTYYWDGNGEAVSAANTFSAYVAEWEGFYAFISEVDSAGPFLSDDEAIDYMNKYCGTDESDDDL